MDDLIAFLNEQLASRKAMAVQAKRSLDEWQRGNSPDNRWRLDEDGISINIKGEYVCVGPEVAVFLAFNDPDMVLADVESKRAILADCVYVLSSAEDSWGQGVSAHELAVDTLKNLATPFAGHEGYRAEWKNGALPIPVTPTSPPSQQVHVLGVDVHCGPAYANHSRAVVVGIGPDGVEVRRGTGSERGIPDIPAVLEGFSPIAVVRLMASQACIQNRDIWPLAPGETIPKGWYDSEP